MKLGKIKYVLVALAMVATGVVVYYSHDTIKKLGNNITTTTPDKIDPAFADYISAFTSGYISTHSSIKIKFNKELSGSTQLNTPIKENYFSFEPALEGITVWKDAQTIEFTPSKPMEQDKEYKATFHLGDLIEVKKELRDFEFQFQTIRQSLQLQANHLKSYNSADFSYYSLSGNISSADVAKNDAIEKTLNAELNGKNLNIKWQHDEAGISHRFTIDSIERPATGSASLQLNCNGKSMDVDYQSKMDYEVPAKEEFKVLNVQVVPEEQVCIQVNFSNPIDATQSLEGLINLGTLKEIKYIVNCNQVLVYPGTAAAGSYILRIEAGVKDAKGRQLEKASEHSIVFDELKPAVRFMGNGNILPSTSGLTVPFETVNLKAVDVTIIKIYENNVLQFLQSNSLDGSSQISQVGKKIVQKHINLGLKNPADFRVWKKFSLDLSSLFKAEQGAIYRVIVRFKKSYSTYSCLGNSFDDKFEMEEVQAQPDEDEISYFNYYSDEYAGNYYEYDENEDYSYEDRDNPCKSYYYQRYERVVSRNIIASDLGISLKKGSNGNIFVAANDLLSTKPLADVEVEFYDYQKQRIQTFKTNSEGMVLATLNQKPYFLVAKKDNQRAYLRLDDGSVLPLTMFEVSGDAIKKGIKGFIYGERGVWRPGDSLHLNFILEDRSGNLPSDHPVSFSLYNPQGQLVKRQLSNKGVDGFYNFSCITDKNAATGFWSAEVKVGAIKFSKSIRIETIMPNRLKINVNVGDNKLLFADKINTINLNTAWLTGAKAKNLAANISVALSAGTTEFAKYKDYNFNDATTRFEAQNVTVFNGKVDENGNATIPLNLDLQKSAPGILKATFNTQVFEPGGAFSVDRFSLDYSPYNYYTGVKLPSGESNTGILVTGRDHFIKVVTLDARGNPVSRGNMKFELYKMEWRWWWDQYNDELANYTSDEYHRAVTSQAFSTINGKAEIKVNINENNWGRYLIRITDRDGGHSSTAIAYFDWDNWMEREGGSDSKIISSMLTFSTDKKVYKTGEEVKVTIPSPASGRALITIENGSRVLEAHWLETEKGSSIFKFNITPQMAPNVYVHVSLIQPHSHTNDLPIRLYGVVPIMVDDPETHLKPFITMPEVLIPEQNTSIVVSEENNREMAFTLAVVDEGLLDITRFKTPSPHPVFYAKEALGVKSWDVYDNVIGAFGADLERVLSIGGDGSELSKDGAKANRFKPMVKFFGPYHLNKGQKMNINFKMPMYVGSVRTMLIAGYKGAYGMTEKTTPVKAPIMVLATLPRVLSVTEEVKLPVSVFGGDKNIGATTVKLEVNGLLQVTDGNAKTVNIGKDDEKLVTFNLKVKNQTGIAKAKITATGGGHTAVYELELDVRNPNAYQIENADFTIDAGKSLNQTIKAIGLPGTNSGVLELSTIPPINLEERLRYLITYPHGCIEQTTSKTFAQLYLNDVMELSAEKKSEVEFNIKSGITEIAKFQLPSGAMSYWQGSAETSDWGTNYAGHFLFLAEKKGYALPAGLKKSWINYEQNLAQSYEPNQKANTWYDESQAYRLYVLALANNPVWSAMNRLREYSNISNQARWWLASAYAQAGQSDEAEKILAKTTENVSNYRINYYTFGSSERDVAVMLQTLCLLNKKQQAITQLRKVAKYLSSDGWYSTQTTAFGLVSVATFIKKFGGSSALQAKCVVNGKEVNLDGKSAIVQVPLSYPGGLASLSIQNNGKGILFARAVSRGKPPIGEEKEAGENIAISVVYKDLAGNPINPAEIEQGANFLMSVNIRNLGLVGEIKNLALISYIPSGWEIHNSRMDDNEAAMKNSPFAYQDVKDDKVLTYFDLAIRESRTFNLMLNASYEGRYYLPAISAEAMYDNTVFARNKGQWINVVKTKATAVSTK